MLAPVVLRTEPLILVVDDDRLLRTMAREVLEQLGYGVIEAHDGNEALGLFEEKRPDLVMLDVEMPGRDGISVCAEIREQHPGDRTPILIVTSAEDRTSIDRAYQAGATDFGNKPLNWALLGHRIRFLLRSSRTLRELHRSQSLLAEAQRIAQVGYWCWNNKSGQMEWSDEIYRIFGLVPGTIEPNPSNWWNLIHPDDRAMLRELGRDALAEVTRYGAEHRILVEGDQLKHVNQQAEVVQDRHGDGQWLVGTLQDVSEQRRAREQIRYLANFDGLTGLANRRHFLDSLEDALAEAREHSQKLALLYLDLDRFKTINDTLGHAAGDELLRQVAELLRSQVRASDVVGRLSRAGQESAVSRLGGDEFTILLRDVTGPQTAGEVAQRILRDLPRVVSVEQRGIAPTVSMGIALFPADGEDADTLMGNADTAMYQAKQGGRNSCQFFCSSMNTSSVRKLRVEAALRRALESGGLELHYQPRIDLNSGRPTGFEGLLRWTDPELGRIPPMEAVGVAEETGLIGDLTRWNFEAACAQIRAWRERGYRPLPIAVNVPTHRFESGDLCAAVAEVLQRNELEPALLEVEITEHAVLADNEVVAQTLRDLRVIGVRVALDDFGTGYSSLSYLTQLPLDMLKLDRTFLREVDADPRTKGVVRSVIAMARSLDLRIVAEGVDAEEQREVLREMGCDEMQGFLISPAVPGDEATRFLEKADSGDPH